MGFTIYSQAPKALQREESPAIAAVLLLPKPFSIHNWSQLAWSVFLKATIGHSVRKITAPFTKPNLPAVALRQHKVSVQKATQAKLSLRNPALKVKSAQQSRVGTANWFVLV